jgi:Domain of unknown function (DUF4340)
MSPKGFAVLAAATAVSLGLAAWAVTGRDAPVTASAQPEPMFAGLLQSLNDVHAVKVTGGGGEPVTVRRAEGGRTWRVEERGGYPADPEKVRELALGLANLRLVEAKTASPERLPRLDLGDPAKPDAKAREVQLLGKDGKPLAAAVVGKTKYGLYGGGRAGVYVRRAGEDQAWLAAGSLVVPGGPLDMVAKEVVDIPADELGRITLGADGPSPLVASKPDRQAEAFTLAAAPPEGRTVDPEKLDRLAGTLAGLVMQDVKPLAQVPFAAEAPKARFETWDGLVVEARVTKTGEGDKSEHWVTLAAAPGEPLAPAPPPAASPAASGTPAEPAAGSAPAAATTPAAKPAADRAAELKAKLDGWAFKLSEFAAARIGWTLNDLLAAPDAAS